MLMPLECDLSGERLRQSSTLLPWGYCSMASDVRSLTKESLVGRANRRVPLFRCLLSMSNVEGDASRSQRRVKHSAGSELLGKVDVIRAGDELLSGVLHLPFYLHLLISYLST